MPVFEVIFFFFMESCDINLALNASSVGRANWEYVSVSLSKSLQKGTVFSLRSCVMLANLV